MVVIILPALGAGRIWADSPTPQVAIETKLVPVSSRTSLDLGVGWDNVEVHGNVPRWQQYVTPPRGIFLGEVALQRWAADGCSLLDLHLYDVAQPSANGNLWMSLGRGALVARAQQRHSSFYPDWEEPAGGSESRRDGRYDLTAPLGRGEFRASYRETKLAPTGGVGEGDNWRDDFSGLRYAGHAGNWQGGLSYQNERFSFAGGMPLSGSAATTALSVTPPTGDRTFLEGSASVTRTSLDERAQAPRYSRLALQGGQILTPDLTLFGDVSHYGVSRSIAESAFARSGSDGQLTAEYRGLWHTTLDLGAGVRNVHFVDDDQAETTSTNVRNFQAKLVTRFTRRLKLKAAHTRWWWTNRPMAFDLAGEQEGSLVWSGKTDQRAELSYTPSGRCGVSANWRQRKWDNSDFGARDSLQENNLFGWWAPHDGLTAYASIMWQNFGLSGPFPGGVLTTDNRTWVVGGSYQVTPWAMADLSFTRSQSHGALGEDQRIWSAGFSHRWSGGDRLSANFVIDDCRTSEETPAFDYNAHQLEVRFTKAAF
jgi:hypothetical protein